jgi:PKD repeat protein
MFLYYIYFCYKVFSMKAIKIFSILLLLFYQTKGFSQDWVEKMHDPNMNFYETKAAFEAYWEGKTIEKGKGYSIFKRWENYVEPRVFPSGDLSLLGRSVTNYSEWEADKLAAGVAKSLSGTWTSIGPFGSFGGNSGNAGRLNFVRFDPTNTNVIWVGAPDGGLWKSIDGGNSWTTNTDELSVIGVSDVAIDPSNPQIMYLATGDSDGKATYSTGKMKSIDGGVTWNTTGLNWLPSDGKNISRIIINPTNTQVILVFSSSGIYRSSNGGSTFTLAYGGNGWKDGEFKPGDPNIVYACGGSFFSKSINGGASWTSVNLPLTGVGRLSLAVSEDNPSIVYLLAASISDWGFKGLMRSTNSGTSFTIQSTTPNILGRPLDGTEVGGQGWYDLAIAVSPTNADEIIVGGINQWKSTNGGVSFTIFTSCSLNPQQIPQIHADVHDIQYLPGSGNIIFSVTDGGLYKTADGISWVGLNSNLAIAQQYRLALSSSSPNLILTGHQDNGTNKTTDLTNWSNIYGADGMDCLIDWNSNNNNVISMQNGNYFRYVSGAIQLINDPPGGSWLSPIHQDPSNPNQVFAGGRPILYKCSNIWTSNPNDIFWQPLGVTNGNDIIEFEIAPNNNQIIYTLTSNGISISNNGGVTFTSCSNPVPGSYPTRLAISNLNSNTVYVTYSGYSANNKVFKSTDAGQTWINLSAGLPNIPVNCIVYQNNADGGDRIYIGTDNGVFYRDNSSNGWIDFSAGLPNCAIVDLEIFYPSNLIRAATYGRGSWESDLYNLSPIPPQAYINANTILNCVNQTFQFISPSYGIPTNYNWTFLGGNPSTSSSENPIISYNSPGTYDVSLTVSNANGSSSITQTSLISIFFDSIQGLPFNEGFENGDTTFSYTGASQTYILPQGVSSLQLTVEGAQGEGMPGCGNGGFGGRVKSSISVNPGQTLYMNVGGQGSNSNGGYNGGGNGASCTQIIGGGGGGASDIRINGNSLSNRVIVAAGGGGAGINCGNNSDHGGGGGGDEGLSGFACNSQTLYVGLGGTQSSGGASLSAYGTSGSLGQGGNGTCAYGGGGGGGYYGGGGGSFGGGGGGSSFVDGSIATSASTNSNVRSGHGQIETDIFPPQYWTINDPNNHGTWQKDKMFGCSPTPNNSVAFYNLWILPDGNVDDLLMPKLDFSNLSSAKLTFDVAYAAYNSTFYDGLEILVSYDCGNNWTSVYNKTGYNIGTGNLPTAPAQFWPFEPLANQWRSDTVDLTPFINNANVQIAFRNIKGFGNHLYLDNINITGAPPTPPIASFTSDYNSTICEGDSIQFYSNSYGIPIVHNWSFPGGSPSSSSEINPTVSYYTAGNFSAQLIVNNTSGADTLIMNTLNVNSYPNVTLDLSSVGTPCVNYTSVPLTGGVPLGGIYSGIGVSNGVFNPSIAGLGQHTITYSYTENGCTSYAPFDLIVDECSSIDNLSNDEILIYPNPTDGKLILGGNSFYQYLDLYLIDIAGRICETWKLDNNKMELDLTKYANGFYNLKFQNQFLEINKTIQILK